MNHPYKEKQTESEQSKLPEYVTIIGEDYYRVDFSKLDPEIDKFPCPGCGTIISPDEETDETYRVLGRKEKNETLKEVLLKCNKCGSKITISFPDIENEEKR